jgi:hypothetical protein
MREIIDEEDIFGELAGAPSMKAREYLRRYSRPTRKYWTSVCLRIDGIPPGHTYVDHVEPYQPFKIRWVIVTTRGFSIVRAVVGNMIFIDDSATDLYYVGHWDELERLGQLDRVRVDAAVCSRGDIIGFDVKNEGPEPATFEVGIIGEAIDSPRAGYLDDAPDLTPYGEAVAGPPIVADAAEPPGALSRYCQECGVPAGTHCFGTKRGEFHKRREKVKP